MKFKIEESPVGSGIVNVFDSNTNQCVGVFESSTSAVAEILDSIHSIKNVEDFEEEVSSCLMNIKSGCYSVEHRIMLLGFASSKYLSLRTAKYIFSMLVNQVCPTQNQIITQMVNSLSATGGKEVRKFIDDVLTFAMPFRAVILEDVGDNVKSDTYLFKSSHDLHAYLLGKNVYKKLIHTTTSTESMVREFNCLEKNVYRLVDGKWYKKVSGSFEAVKFSFLDKIKSIVYKIENMVRN